MSTPTYEDFVSKIEETIFNAKTFHLVDVGQGDSFGLESLDYLLAEDWDSLDALHGDWLNEVRWEGARWNLNCVADVAAWQLSPNDPALRHEWKDEWETDGADRDDLLLYIVESDSSDWEGDLMKQTYTPTLMRVVTEAEVSDEPIEDFLTSYLEDMGVDINFPSNKEAIDNIAGSTPTGYRRVEWVFTPENLIDLFEPLWAGKREVTVARAGLWLTNPFQGDGWFDEIEGPITFRYSDIRTDAGGHLSGWSLDDVAGLIPGAFKTEILTKIEGK